MISILIPNHLEVARYKYQPYRMNNTYIHTYIHTSKPTYVYLHKHVDSHIRTYIRTWVCLFWYWWKSSCVISCLPKVLIVDSPCSVLEK